MSARGRVPASTAGPAPRRTNLWPGGPRRRIARGNWLAGRGRGRGGGTCAARPGLPTWNWFVASGNNFGSELSLAKPRRVPRPGWAGQQVTRWPGQIRGYWADINHRSLVTISSTICSGPVTLDTGDSSVSPPPQLRPHRGAGLLGWSLRPRADGVFARPRLNIEHEESDNQRV